MHYNLFGSGRTTAVSGGSYGQKNTFFHECTAFPVLHLPGGLRGNSSFQGEGVDFPGGARGKPRTPGDGSSNCASSWAGPKGQLKSRGSKSTKTSLAI